MPETTSAASPVGTGDPLEALSPVLVHLYSGYLIRTLFELGLADQVEAAGTAVDALAERVQAEPRSLRKLLHALSSIGIFQPSGQDCFAHTAASTMLRSENGGSAMLEAFARSEWAARTWEHLPEAVRSGQAAFPKAMGKPFYDYLNQDDPDSAAAFNAAMTQGIGSTNDAVVEALDLSSTTDIVDVGGGQGTLLRDILHANPQLRGTLFDIGHALTDVDQQLRSGALAERCEIEEGDARVAVPSGADAYVFRMILHNWDDDSCVRLLRSCAHNAKSGARVLVAEVVLPQDGAVSEFTAMFDMQMFVLFGSNERTAAEYAALFERAGLDYVGVTETSSVLGIVEARVR